MNQGLQGKSDLPEANNTAAFDIETSGGNKACPFGGGASGKPMPPGHEQYSEGDKEKCPVMSGKVKAPEPTAGGEAGATKTKKPKGGCPFMPSDNKKPPALELYTAAYEEPYISALRYLINFRGFLSNDEGPYHGRERWENMPVFLKHTMFHNEEKMGKIRKLEVAHRFFVYDKFREQANKSFNKGRPEEAIGLFEHALSCFKWVSFKEVKKDKKKKSRAAKVEEENDNLSEKEVDITTEKEKDDDNSEIKDDFDETQDDEGEGEGDAEGDADADADGDEDDVNDDDVKPLNKALITIITDENVELHDGEEITDESERDMRNSMLLNVYQGLAVCYLKLHYYKNAQDAIAEAFKLNDKSSQLFFRRAQTIAFNKGATYADLLKAKSDIERALEMKHYEKLFQSEPGILKILNLHNADEVYLDQARYIEATLKERRQIDLDNTKALLARVKEIEFIEDALRKEGKIPAEDSESTHAVEINNYDEEQMEWEIINEMVGKYIKIIEFYQETEKKEQVEIARKEIQVVLELREQMRFYHDLDFTKWEENELVKELLKDITIDMTSKKVQDRLRRLKNNKAKELFENGKFNLEVFQYALKDYFRKKEEKEEKLKKEKGDHDDIEPKKSRLASIFGLEFILQIAAIGLMFCAFWYLHQNDMLPTGIFWSDHSK